jgi:hypothetical protein
MYVDTFDNIGQEKTSMKHIYQALCETLSQLKFIRYIWA